MQTTAKPSFLSQSGPLFLLGAFAVLIYKCSYVIDLFWLLLLVFSVGLSWLLIFLGGKESDRFLAVSEENALILKERCQNLEEKLRLALKAHADENQRSIAEKEQLSRRYAEMVQGLSRTQDALEVSEKTLEQSSQECRELAQDISEYQRKEAALQHALDEAQAQLQYLKNQQKSIAMQEEVDPQEKMQLSQVQRQYALLREQFEEKSETLDKTRRELFHVENAFFALQKSHEEASLGVTEENLILVKDLKELEEECCDLEIQVQNLQEIITTLQAPKKRTVRTRKLKAREDLPDLIQEKIDQANSVHSS